MQLDGSQLETLCTIAEAAGREIMDVYAGDIASWDKPDASPLTEADLRADRVIRSGLERSFPGMFILSEESRSAGTGAPEAFFLVDPLDGTREFLKRNDEFTVNIALVVAGVPEAGVVLAPALGQLYFAAKGLGAFRRVAGTTAPIHVRPAAAGEALRVMGSRSHASDELGAWLARLGRGHSFVAAGSSLKFCRIAEGAADLYPRLATTCEWDVAAGHALIEAAGGAVTLPDGAALRYGNGANDFRIPAFIAWGDRSVMPPAG